MNKLKLLVERLRSSRESKTVLKNFGYLTFLKIAGYIFPLITMPYLAKTIGSYGYGKIAFAAAIICWVQTITDWGFDYTATRDVAFFKEDKNRVSEILSNVLWSKCFLLLLSLLLLALVIAVFPLFRENYEVIVVTALMVPGKILFPEWFFQALERMKFITYFNLAIKFTFTVLVFIVIHKPADFIYQPLLVSFSYLLSGFISFAIILKKWGYKLHKPNLRGIYNSLSRGFDVFLSNLFPNIYNSFSIMLVGSFAGATANGIYEGGNKITTVAQQFHAVISKAFYPLLSRKIDKHKVFSIVNIGSGLFISLVLFFCAPLFIKFLLSSEFSESVLVLRILSISLFFMILFNTYGVNYLIVIHKENVLRKITVFCSLLGGLLAYPLVSNYSFLGAALTVLISRILMGVSVFFYSRRVNSI